MAVTTTVHDNFSKTAFFDSREWLNQENWQMYFGGALPSGVLVKGKLETSGINYVSALARHEISSSYIQFHPGSIMANGIYAYYASGTSIPVIKSAEIDRLFVARVYVSAGYVRIVGMTKVAAEYGYTPTVFAKMLLQDESLAMTRNSTYYDIPLLYEIFGGDAYDLRRLIYLPGQAPDVEINFSDQEVTNTATIPGIMYGKYFVQTYGGMNYNVNFLANDTSPCFYVYPNPSCSEKPTIVKLTNNSSTVKQIRIPLTFKSLTLSYSWLESWDSGPNTQYLYKDMVAGDRMTLVFTPNGHETTFNYTVTNKGSATGGGVDPDDYFTKQEIAAQMLLKANVSDMDEALALKEDKTALGDLAYQNEVDYTTQVSNKPTLGALAAKDQAVLTTDVTGILPESNGGTGSNSLTTVINDKINDYFNVRTVYYSGTKSLNLVVSHGEHIIIKLTGNTTLSGANNDSATITVDGGILEINTNNYSLTVTSASKVGAVNVINGGKLISTNNYGSLIFTSSPTTTNYPPALLIDTCSIVNITTNLSCSSTGSYSVICKSFATFTNIATSQNIMAQRGIILIKDYISPTYLKASEGGIITLGTYGGVDKGFIFTGSAS